MRKSEQPDEFVPDLSKFNTQYNYCFALIKNLKRLLDLYSSVEEMEKKRYPTNTYKRKIEDLSKRITKAFAREKV